MKNRHFILAAMLAAIGFGFWAISQLEFDKDMRAIKLATDKELNAYNELTKDFPSYTSSTIVILENQGSWSRYKDYLLIDSITRFIQELPNVNGTSSITNLLFPRKTAFGMTENPYVDLSSEEKFNKWFEKREQFPDINEKFISDNERYTLLFVNSENGLDSNSIKQIKHYYLLTDSQYEIRILQDNLTQKAVKSDFINESIFLAILCILLILTSFYLLTRSFIGLGLIGITILFNISLTAIAMYCLEISFNLQMLALPCLIIIFSFTDIMHILYHQSLLKDDNGTNSGLRKELLQRLRTPILLTSISNLFGFIIFLFLSENERLTHLALISIIGITIAYLTSRYLIIPMMTNSRTYIRKTKIEKVQQVTTSMVQRFSLSRNIAALLLLIITCSFTYLLIQNFKIDTQKGVVTKDYEIQLAQGILSNHFYGSKSLEIILEFSSEEAVWDRKNLLQMELVEKEMQNRFHALYCISPVTIIKRYQRFATNGSPKAYKIPKRISEKTKTALKENYALLGGDQIITKDRVIGRIIIGYNGFELDKSRQEYARLVPFLKEVSTGSMQMKIGGIDYLADNGTYTFTKNLLIAWSIGILLATLILAFILKSLQKGLVFLFVNLLPLLLVLWIMPHLLLEINPQSLFLMTILAGLCVDDSIFILLHKKSINELPAYFPIIVTSSVLGAGFFTFQFSYFDWLSPFARIFLIGIVVALVLDLFILPLFMLANDNEK